MIDLLDPVAFYKLCWPKAVLYDKQIEIMQSVRYNDETVVAAGNGLGKDYIAAVIALHFFCSRRPARVVTTSVKYDQLNDVLWGEIRRLIDTSAIRLPINYNHMHIRQVRNDNSFVPLCELVGQCVSQNEGLLGRHLPRDIPRTLVIFDEASGISDGVYNSTDTWAHRKLIIGNPFPCTNFFRRAVKEGPKLAPDGSHKYREVLKIRAVDSPNVKLSMFQKQRGETITGEVLVPGLVDYDTYKKRRMMWGKMLQCVGLDAEFYEGADAMLFPGEWLRRAEDLAANPLNAKAETFMGVDTAEGGDNTCWAIGNEYGLIRLVSEKTPDTSVIPIKTLQLMAEYHVTAKNVLFDAGGGGKQHADYLRRKGHKVRSVAFGASASMERQRGLVIFDKKKMNDETRYAYRNRRAEMYGTLRNLLDPLNERGFGIPRCYEELINQLSPIPLLYDGEGRMYLPPKRRKDPNSNEVTLTELIGHSPDEADALVLMVYGTHQRQTRRVAGAINSQST